jgi:hypothetical protein
VGEGKGGAIVEDDRGQDERNHQEGNAHYGTGQRTSKGSVFLRREEKEGKVSGFSV